MAARARLTAMQRREQLVGVGRQVFAERGYEATSVEEIAERADVSKPVVYQHFGGKDGLYAVVLDREVSKLLDMITRALDDAEEPHEALHRAAAAFLEYVETSADGFRILVRDAPVGSAHGSLPSVLGDVAAHAESILAAEFKARGFSPKLAPLYSRALVGMVALVGEWWLGVGKPKRDEVAAHVVNLAWNGLKGLEPDPKPPDSRRKEPAPAGAGLTPG